MLTFDKEEFQIQFDFIKLNQSSMQQLMTLSAGGLALFFSFIDKSPIFYSLHVLGSLVVLSWMLSLCAAAICHYLQNDLISKIYENSNKKLDTINDIKEKVDANDKVYDRSNKLKEFVTNIKILALEQMLVESVAVSNYQQRIKYLMSFSLSMFVLGFIFLFSGFLYISFGT